MPTANAHFEHINAKAVVGQAAGQPVISVDTKEKELTGDYRNGGTDYRPKDSPRRVKVHDFEDKELGKVVPYGVYDVGANEGWVSVGITSDTADFAVASIRCWLERMGRPRYPKARELTIMADCGGSNGARVRLWKVELQALADETGLPTTIRPRPAQIGRGEFGRYPKAESFMKTLKGGGLLYGIRDHRGRGAVIAALHRRGLQQHAAALRARIPQHRQVRGGARLADGQSAT